MANMRAMLTSGGRVLAVSVILSSAGVQWASSSAQEEARRQKASSAAFDRFRSLLERYESPDAAERNTAAQELAGLADRLPESAKAEPIVAGARRVQALASFQSAGERSAQLIQDRLRDEVRGLAQQAHSLEAQALGRAEVFQHCNLALLISAGLFVLRSGGTVFRHRSST
jgi:hypothetical protein